MGARFFFTGRPCRRGHVAPKYTSTGGCAECARSKATASYKADPEAGRKAAKARYSADPELLKRRVRERRLREPKKVAAEKRREYERHKSAYLKRTKKWAKENRLRLLETARAWRRKNPDKVALNVASRRATRKLCKPLWLTKAHRGEMELMYAESRRLTDSTGVLHNVDHIIPLCGETVSGLHVPWNLQVITAAENRKKSNALPGEEAAA